MSGFDQPGAVLARYGCWQVRTVRDGGFTSIARVCSNRCHPSRNLVHLAVRVLQVGCMAGS